MQFVMYMLKCQEVEGQGVERREEGSGFIELTAGKATMDNFRGVAQTH
jgi:hypothetical protein